MNYPTSWNVDDYPNAPDLPELTDDETQARKDAYREKLSNLTIFEESFGNSDNWHEVVAELFELWKDFDQCRTDEFIKRCVKVTNRVFGNFENYRDDIVERNKGEWG